MFVNTTHHDVDAEETLKDLFNDLRKLAFGVILRDQFVLFQE